MRKSTLMKRGTLLLLSFCMILSHAWAQEQTVTGQISSEEEGALPGVNILIKGTSTGTVTDLDGNFSIAVPGPDAVLVFSSIGYTVEEVTVGSQSVINLVLTQDITALSEIVVTGYTTQRKKDITGAVTVVDADELKSIKAATVGQQLAGRATGVTTRTSGQPGDGINIRIRGYNSFNSSDPLFVIDGVQIQGDKALTGLNPNDIESMQVLKDAAAASLYGSRASNGVIIITTKKGKAGKVSVTYDGYYGSQTPVGGYNDFLVKDPREYAEWHVQSNPSTSTFYGPNLDIPTYFYPTNADGTPNPNVDESTYNYPTDPRVEPTLIMRSNQDGTDWWDETFDTAPITGHTLGLAGGSENGTYAASIDYFNQQGTMIHTYFERFSARINSEMRAGKFKFGENIGFTRSNNVGVSGGNQNEQNTMTQILKLNPIVPVRDIGGNFASAKTVGFSNGTNPVARQIRDKDDETINYRILGSVFGSFDITDYLTFKSSFGIDMSQLFQQNFAFPTWENREVNSTNFFSETHTTYYTWVWTNTLQFQKQFNEKHNLGVLLGYEALESTARRITGRVDNFGSTSNDLRYLNLSLASFNNVNSFLPQANTLASVFGKLDYNSDDKYLVSFTYRRDGSSNFGPQERYGTFPAFSLGWRMSEEDFMQNVSWLDDFKIRGGWGVRGNQIIPITNNAFSLYGARSTYDAGYNISGNNTGNAIGVTQTTIGNPGTGWEENSGWNAGFDAALVSGRLNIVFDYYNNDIKQLLYAPPFPGSAGNAQTPFQNVANMTNNGWDLAVNYLSNSQAAVTWNIGMNLSHYKNEIVQLDGQADFIFAQGIDKRFGEVNALTVGSPISSFYGLTQDGIFQNDAEAAALDQPGAQAGRFRWKDLNNDGQINDDDRGIIGSPHPDATLGLNFGLNYKKWDFVMFLFGSFGNDIYNYNKLFTHFGFFNSNIHKDVITQAWTGEGSGGTLPAIDGGDSFSFESSSFYVEDGSYLRAKQITIGYTFPANKVFESLRLYVQGQNLFTITSYEGIDPELSNVNVGGQNNVNQDNQWTGFDFGNYPSARTFMFGVSARF